MKRPVCATKKMKEWNTFYVECFSECTWMHVHVHVCECHIMVRAVKLFLEFIFHKLLIFILVYECRCEHPNSLNVNSLRRIHCVHILNNVNVFSYIFLCVYFHRIIFVFAKCFCVYVYFKKYSPVLATRIKMEWPQKKREALYSLRSIYKA